MAMLEFAVVPFVKTDGAVNLGELTFWRSTKSEWNARMGVDPPSLLEVYRGRDSRSREDALSILSPAVGAQASFGQYQDAIVVLSTADWLRGVSGTASDAWLFEPWRIDPANAFHARTGKFSLNLTDAAHDRLYPDPYTHPVRFVRFGTDEIVQKLEPWLTTGADVERNRLTALWHLYLARRGAPYFNSVFEDLEAVWSAFEAWFRLPRTPGYVNDSQWARFARAWLPRRFARRLTPSVWERRPRSSLVYEGLARGLEPILDERLVGDLKDLVDELYALRSEQTHGGTPAPERLRREAQDAHVLDLALAVWRVLLDQTLFGENPFFAEENRAKLRDMFLEQELHDRLLAAFADRDRKEWCDDDGKPGNPAHVEAQADLFREILEITVIPRRYRGTAAAHNACRKALLVVSAWAKAAEANSGGVFRNTAGTSGLHGEFSRIVDSKPKDLHADLVQALVTRKLHESGTFDDEALRAEIGVLAGIDFPTWVRVVVRLRELFLGYELL